MRRRQFITRGLGAVAAAAGWPAEAGASLAVARRYIEETLGLSTDSAAPVEHDASA